MGYYTKSDWIGLIVSVLMGLLSVYMLGWVSYSALNPQESSEKAIERLAAENEALKTALSKYTIANGRNYAREQLGVWDEIAYEYGLPKAFLDSVGIHKNIGRGFDFGVKRIPAIIQDKYHVSEWQARAAARIIQQELADYVLKDDGRRKEFLDELASRYCYWQRRNWSKSVGKIYEGGGK